MSGPEPVRGKLGLIQSGSIGDIIIGLPIADYYIERGVQVFWPIHEKFVAAFRAVAPQVNFIPIPATAPDPDLDTPAELLRAAGCEQIVVLYSFLVGRKRDYDWYSYSLKFDEYKYAVAAVPFARKWTLNLRRDAEREQSLHRRLNITGPYICAHLSGSDVQVDYQLPPEFTGGHKVVMIEPLTDSPFDWIYTLEHASKLLLLDSCFANLVEQLNLPNEKYLVLRSKIHLTPVYKNGWRFLRLPQQPKAPPPL